MEKNRQVILLINPWIHDFSAYDLWLKPLGLLYIGSYLEKYGYNVQLIDCLDYQKTSKSYGCNKFYSEEITKPCYFRNIPRKYKRYGIPPTQFTRILMQIKEQTQPILVAVTSMMTYWYPGVFDTIKYVKQVFDDTPVVLGGVYATLCYEHAKKYSGADYVIKGGGEEKILKLAQNLSDNSNPPISLLKSPSYPPFVKGEKGGLGSIFPSYHLYNWNKNETNSVAMITSKGCPFRCSYCASSSLFNGFIQRSPEDVVREIEYYQTGKSPFNPPLQKGETGGFDITDIAFYDDALLVNPVRDRSPSGDRKPGIPTTSLSEDKTKESVSDKMSFISNGVNREKHIDIILDLLIQRGLNKKIRFHTPNGLHIRYIDKNLAQKLYQANFKTIRLGFESVEREGDSDHKVSKDNLSEVIKNLKQAGFTTENIGVYILMGLPDQTLEEIERTIEFVHKSGALIKIAQYSPVPHSSDFEKVIISYPEIATEPLLQNKSVYYCHDKGVKFKEFETLKNKIRQLNAVATPPPRHTCIG